MKIRKVKEFYFMHIEIPVCFGLYYIKFMSYETFQKFVKRWEHFQGL